MIWIKLDWELPDGFEYSSWTILNRNSLPGGDRYAMFNDLLSLEEILVCSQRTITILDDMLEFFRTHADGKVSRVNICFFNSFWFSALHYAIQTRVYDSCRGGNVADSSAQALIGSQK